jgi:DNA-binding transcriptional LysR family regulator
MPSTSLRDIDLNLLVILEVLLGERSVTRAAQRLHLTPSAVSHALKRLRELFDDELLVRDGRRMSPTVRAQEIAETLPTALRHVAHVLTAPEPFDPVMSTRVFRLAAPDFVAPLILQEVSRAAPHVRVEWVSSSSITLRELSLGRCDALIAPSVVKHEGLRAHSLGEWPWKVYGRAGHPAFKRWSMQAWSNYSHLQIWGTRTTQGQGPIDRRLAQLGVERHIGAVVPYFSMAAAVVANSDLLLTVPCMTMAATQERFDLEEHELPFELPRMSLSLFRSATGGDEPGVRWFLERIQAACSRL